MDENRARHNPGKKPYSCMNTGAIRAAPASSKRITPFTMKPVYFTMPPRFGADTASCMVDLVDRPICLPVRLVSITVSVTTPIPPIWMSMRMTT